MLPETRTNLLDYAVLRVGYSHLGQSTRVCILRVSLVLCDKVDYRDELEE